MTRWIVAAGAAWAALSVADVAGRGRARRRLGLVRGGPRVAAAVDHLRAARSLVGEWRRWWRWAGVAAVAALVAGPLPVLVAAGVVPVVRLVRVRAADRARRRAVVDELPQLVDLLRLAVEAGLTVPLVLAEVTAVADGPVATALAGARSRAGRGLRLADALEEVRDVDPLAAPLVDALVAAERYGAALGPALDRLGADLRGLQRRAAEAEARRVPVRLLFPLVACVLPSVGLLTVVPVAVAALDDLSL